MSTGYEPPPQEPHSIVADVLAATNPQPTLEARAAILLDTECVSREEWRALVRDLLAALPQWISVSERSPERDADGNVQAVLVMVSDDDGLTVEFGEHRPRGWALVGEDDPQAQLPVTHWMTPPEALKT